MPFSSTKTLVILLTCVVVGAGVSCGKRKPPLPPIKKVAQRAEISGFQRGDRVHLSWKMPDANAPAGSHETIRRVDVYRLSEALTQPPNISEAEFASRSVLIGTISVKPQDIGSRLTYTDRLQLAGQPSRLRYAVRFVNDAGQKAPFSNLIVIEPAGKVAAEPSELAADVTQDAIVLTWNTPSENADGSTPVNLVGFNVYRSPSKDQAAKLLNAAPVSDPKYTDKSFEFGKTYFYFVRAVSSGTGAVNTESAESNIVEIAPQDTFAPTAPSSITIGASPGTISIFFPPNPEPDVVGYNIYRSTDSAKPKPDWDLLTPTPTDATTFQDTKVEAGNTYHYYVIAIDKAGNKSEASEVVSETVPESDGAVPLSDAIEEGGENLLPGPPSGGKL